MKIFIFMSKKTAWSTISGIIIIPIVVSVVYSIIEVYDSKYCIQGSDCSGMFINIIAAIGLALCIVLLVVLAVVMILWPY